MRTLSLIVGVLSMLCICACQNTPKKTAKQEELELDSFSRAKYGESSAEHIKKMTDSVIAKSMLDTEGLYKAPVKILNSKVVKKEYSTYRSVYLRYKNTSGKTITGIKFKWYGTNAFNEPAEFGSSFAHGFGGGFTDDMLRPGRSDDGTWDVLSQDGKKIKLAWPYEVSFEDGTNWKLK